MTTDRITSKNERYAGAVCLFMYLFVCLFVCPSVCPHASPPVCLSTCLLVLVVIKIGTGADTEICTDDGGLEDEGEL